MRKASPQHLFCDPQLLICFVIRQSLQEKAVLPGGSRARKFVDGLKSFTAESPQF
jgi:hypothetical protein